MPHDKHEITASLLAHLGDDAGSRGSGFEGNNFSSTFGYLSQYMKANPPQKIQKLVNHQKFLKYMNFLKIIEILIFMIR